jgi:hypothetical protein
MIELTPLHRTGRLLQPGNWQASDDGSSPGIEHAPRCEDIMIRDSF